MLTARGVTKRYGSVVALRDAHLSLLPGEVVALAGENGSGKSTLSRLLAGVARPDAGQILIDGEPVSFAGPHQALDAGVAMVSQELTVVPHLSVAENVGLPFLRGAARSLFRRRRLADRVGGVLADAGLADVADVPVRLLPPVRQTFVEVAKALATSPRYLVLDEATSRLGPQDVGRLLEEVRRLAAAGVGIVLITHRIAEMTSTADRAVVLRDGEVVGELLRAELTEPALVSLMVGRELSQGVRRRGRAGGADDVVLDVRDVTVDGAAVGSAAVPVSLQVRRGEIVGLAGLVGAGRSELLEALVGVRRRSGGPVSVGGRTLPAGDVGAARAAGVCLVPEDRHRQGLVLPFSVAENYALGRHRAGAAVNRAADRDEARRAVARFGIKTADVDLPVTSLSGGNQQKVVLARAVSTHPKVLLLDEPTRGVDVGARADIYRIVAGLADDGLAVLLASSDLVELLAICDRVVVMHERAVVGDLARADATEESITLLSAGGSLHADVA